MKDTDHMTKINSINITIEVHIFCLHLEMKGHWLRVNRSSQDLHVTSVLSFPNAKKKKCTSILNCFGTHIKSIYRYNL